MADPIVKVGQTVLAQNGSQGVVKYVGALHIASGEWVGLELPDSTGKNDGSVKGERYFDCQSGHGIFIRRETVVRVIKQPPAQVRTNGTVASNGTTARARPSSGATADVARKRQSLMSAGSGAGMGSRLSVRVRIESFTNIEDVTNNLQSPAKTPTRPAASFANSTSTSRTGTPATTARTSDSSTKSRMSISGRPSTDPPTSATRTHALRSSIGGAPIKSSVRPNASQPRQPLPGSRLSSQLKSAQKQQGEPLSRSKESEDQLLAPTIDEEEEDTSNTNLNEHVQEEQATKEDAKLEETTHAEEQVPITIRPTRTASISRTMANGSVESRAAQQREIEQLKAKIRTLEKKRLEDRDRLKSVETLQSDRDRFENIIQALKKKLKVNQQEMADIRAKYEESETRASQQVDNRDAEHDTELELATLDKEMAEERAEQFQAELEALKVKHEELELEADILREENHELGSIMSPEEKASAGWLQMERETERLRQALTMLRDMSQQNEGDLRSQIKELQESLDDAEKTALKYDETAEKLMKSEETKKHLMEQLEAAEMNDEIVEAMEAQKEQHLNSIGQLQRQIQDLEEHIQVTDELESFHVEEEKRLHYQLDESEALLSERQRLATEQERVIEDLEYTMTKFRNVVQGLQSDIDELRRSRDISELQAHEMSSKSRAMMDLNLQLQNSAVKTQMKAIDVELGRMRAEQASLHLDIVQLFVPDSFEEERNPVLALLAFRRMKSKASLIKNLLADRMRERPHLSKDDPFTVFEIMEKTGWITTCCERFVQFAGSCSSNEFTRFSGAPYEIEPVERTLTSWVEALRRDELSTDGPNHLQRMIGIMADMADKLVVDKLESKATQLFGQASMIETYADSIANQLTVISREAQSKLGPPKNDDEGSLVFDKKFDHFCTKARTIKYLAGKATQALADLRSGSMCPGQTTWVFFEEAEQAAHDLAQLVRDVGVSVLKNINKLDTDTPLTYTSLMELMTSLAQTYDMRLDSKAPVSDDIFAFLGSRLQALQSKVDELNSKSADPTSILEFEIQPAPWVTRAKEIKAQRIVSQDVQEELARLKAKGQEQLVRLGEKDKQMEEQQIKVELLESRAKETKQKDESVKAMKGEIEKLRSEKEDAMNELAKIQAEHGQMLQLREAEKAELEALKSSTSVEAGKVVHGLVDETATLHLAVEIDMLKGEIASLQSAVRYLKTENHALRVPSSEAAISATQLSWLNANVVRKPKHDKKAQQLRLESSDVLGGLIDLAKAVRPVRLKPTSGAEQKTKASSWQARKNTTRYQVVKQKEELERWYEWRDDFLNRAKMAERTSAAIRRDNGSGVLYNDGSNYIGKIPLSSGFKGVDHGVTRGGEVEIVSHSP